MKTLNLVAFNDKDGKLTLKTAVTNQIKEQELSKIEDAVSNLDFERLENKAVLVKTYEDANGNVFYATLTLSVSALHPNDKAVKTSKPKAKSNEIVELY